MRIGEYAIVSDGDYYQLRKFHISEKGKHKGQEVESKNERKHFHGIDKLQAYLGRIAIVEVLKVANTIAELEEANQQALKRLFEDK